MPAVNLAQWIERHQASREHDRARIVAGDIPRMHRALERLDCAAPQRLTAKESPFVELRAVSRREAFEEVARIKPAGGLEITLVTSLLELQRVHEECHRWRP